jgi:hypothetical protein
MPERLTGIQQGRRVDNVTKNNRYDVYRSPALISIQLLSEDGKTVIGMAQIDNTRERPDVVLVEGVPYTVLDTTVDPPQYTECMYLHARNQP